MSSAPNRVIIVDDNERVRQSLSIFFETLDDWIIVAEAGNGQEALDLCGRFQPNVVIMDLLMPVMDGITATRRIREQYPHIKVLVLTSATVQADIQAALDAGASGILLKYASIEQIETALRKVSSVKSQPPLRLMFPASPHR